MRGCSALWGLDDDDDDDDDYVDDDDDDGTQANIRTYGKFCSLFEEEVAKVEQELVNITEVITDQHDNENG